MYTAKDILEIIKSNPVGGIEDLIGPYPVYARTEYVRVFKV